MQNSSDGAPDAKGNVRPKTTIHSVIRRFRTLDTKIEKESLECNNSELVAKTILIQLKEHFMCPICFEIMACPYSPRRCGHSFCALCILDWFNRSRSRGAEPLCPTCNALVDPSQTSPKTNCSFPFTPQRAARDAIHGMIDAILKEADCIDVGIAPASVDPLKLAEWATSGRARQLWYLNDRVGHQKMSELTKSWANPPNDSTDVKTTLGSWQESN